MSEANPVKKDPADRLGPNDPPTAAAKQVFGGAMSFANDTRRAWRKAWGQVPTPARWLIGIIGVVFAYSLPLLHLPVISDTKANFPSLLGGTVIIYVIVALGLNVVVGLAGLLDLGYVGFYAIGAYTVAVLSSKHANLPWLLCLPIAIAVAMGSGVLLGAPTLRLRGDYLAIVTLGFGEIIRLLAQKFDWLGAAERHLQHPVPAERRTAEVRRAARQRVLLPRPDPGDHHLLLPAPAGEQPRRPGLDGDP